MSSRVKEIVWIRSTLKDLRECPQQIRKDIGKALYAAQCGETDRAVYAARFENAVYVLHVFQKKAKRGRETPKQDMALIRQRLAVAKRDIAGRQN